MTCKILFAQSLCAKRKKKKQNFIVLTVLISSCLTVQINPQCAPSKIRSVLKIPFSYDALHYQIFLSAPWNKKKAQPVVIKISLSTVDSRNTSVCVGLFVNTQIPFSVFCKCCTAIIFRNAISEKVKKRAKLYASDFTSHESPINCKFSGK